MPDKDVFYLNITLNLAKEQDRLVRDVLSPLPSRSRADYVKMAVLAYATRQGIKADLRAVLGEWLESKQGAAILAPPPEELEVEEDFSVALGFLAGLQGE